MNCVVSTCFVLPNFSVMFSRVSVRFASMRHFSAVKLAYDHYGATSDQLTQPLIIGHGFMGQKKNWRSLAKSIHKHVGNQVFVVDFRNHGDSPHADEHSYPAMVEDLKLFVREVVAPASTFDTFHLLGHSMGGKVVADFALKNESLVEKLIVEDIAPHRGGAASGDDFEIRHYLKAMIAVDLTRTRKEIVDQLRLAVSNENILQFLLMNLVEDPRKKHVWKINLFAFENFLNHILTYGVAGGTFSKPTLFVSGALSSYTTPADRTQLSSIFSDSSFVTIENAGHWVHAEQPKLFLDCVVDFLK